MYLDKDTSRSKMQSQTFITSTTHIQAFLTTLNSTNQIHFLITQMDSKITEKAAFSSKSTTAMSRRSTVTIFYKAV